MAKNSILVETFDHLTSIIVALVRPNVALNTALWIWQTNITHRQLRMTADQAAAKMPLDNKAKYSLVSLALVVILFALVFGVICSNPLMVAPGVALNLEAAKLILLGKVPYLDFFCLSSPLLLYASVVPLSFGQALGLPPSLASNLMVWSLALVSVLSCAAILLLRRHHREWHCFPSFVVAYALANVLMLFQIGQGEHLVMLALTPYFLVRWLRWNGHTVPRREAIVSGIFAAFAACLSHGFWFIAASLEVLWLLSLRRFRPLLALEVRACVCTVSILLLSALALPEAATNEYISLVFPLLSLGYQCHDWSIYGINSVPERRDVFYTAIAAIIFVLPFRRRTSMAAPLAVVFLVGFALYLSQLKGLSQSAIPMIFATALLLSLNLSIAAAIVRRISRNVHRRRMRASAGKGASWRNPLASNLGLFAYAVSILVLAGAFLRQQESKIGRALPLVGEACLELLHEQTSNSSGEQSIAQDSELSSCAAWLAKYSREDDEVMFLTDSLVPGYPLMLQMKRKPTGYLLQSDCLVELEACERESLQPKVFEAYAEKLYTRLDGDIASQRAKMIFVQDVTIDDLLKKHKVASTLLKHYELKGHARLKAANEEPIEHTGFNYKIGVFLPRRPQP